MPACEFIDYEQQTYCWDGKHWFRVSDSTTPPLGVASRLNALLVASRQGRGLRPDGRSIAPAPATGKTGREKPDG
jgi:hypothetical protein